MAQDYRKYILNAVKNSSENEAKPLEMVKVARSKALPEAFSRRDMTPSVRDQGNIGSCVGHAGYVVLGDTEQNKQFELSPMWIYVNGKLNDEWAGENYSGTSIGGACIGLQKSGCCLEKEWLYSYGEAYKPSEEIIKLALNRRIVNYSKIDVSQIENMKTLLLTQSLWISIAIHDNFYNIKQDGILFEEGYVQSKYLGGHSIAMIGWKMVGDKLFWEFQNSWGGFWGNFGYFFVEDSLIQKITLNRSVYSLVLGNIVTPSIIDRLKTFFQSLWNKFKNIFKK